VAPSPFGGVAHTLVCLSQSAPRAVAVAVGICGPIAGHHAHESGAVLGAVNAASLRAAPLRGLRALTAPARSAAGSYCVMADFRVMARPINL
jgi:hypothetical protein